MPSGMPAGNLQRSSTRFPTFTNIHRSMALTRCAEETRVSLEAFRQRDTTRKTWDALDLYVDIEPALATLSAWLQAWHPSDQVEAAWQTVAGVARAHGIRAGLSFQVCLPPAPPGYSCGYFVMFPWDFFHALTGANPSDAILLVLYWDPAARAGEGALAPHYPPSVYFGKGLWDQVRHDAMSHLPSSITDLAVIKSSVWWRSPVIRGYIHPGRESTEIQTDDAARGRLGRLLKLLGSGAGLRRLLPRPTVRRKKGQRNRTSNHGHHRNPPGDIESPADHD